MNEALGKSPAELKYDGIKANELLKTKEARYLTVIGLAKMHIDSKSEMFSISDIKELCELMKYEISTFEIEDALELYIKLCGAGKKVLVGQPILYFFN